MCFPVRGCGFLRASYGALPLSFLRLPLRRRVPGQTDVFFPSAFAELYIH